jgi:tetratricopeptide (TPR) repeat protein
MMKNVTLFLIVPASNALRQGLTKYEKGLKHRMNDVFAILDSNGTRTAKWGIAIAVPATFLFSGDLAEFMTDRDKTSTVRAWHERISIPTYEAGEPDPNPCFLEKRVYQGSSGAVYPYPVVESVSNEKALRDYDAIFLENEYLKIMILPELGGRVQMALDKTNDYHFVYYNRVIKPALVGLAGPWISGGIEFNWPQHHRPSTFHPVDVHLAAGDDGSWTVWCNEIDRMVGTRGMHGFTLYSGKAYLEIQVRLSNRTPLPETFLWWANPAVHVDENHQSIFPPDVCAVMDHGKRDVSTFPIATGEYYKVDYSPGTDISRYKNIPVPTSYMAYHSNYNFVGSYDHGRQAGLLHVASHHVSPGKKQWTWGCGDFGRAWDRQLTDEDGPYVELMCGVYTDNQPDFSWISPGEEKSFSQYFMPYKGVGVIKNATTEAVVGLEIEEKRAVARVYVTEERRSMRVELRTGQTVLIDERCDASPFHCREFSAPLPDSVEATTLQLTVYDAEGIELVRYQPKKVDTKIPEPAQEIAKPEDVDSTESLFLAGLHLEQYRHATRQPEDYFREALLRDPGDIRCNLALGRTLYRRGEYGLAEEHFGAAIERATRHNPNPADAECHYDLGLTLAAQGMFDAAEEAFHKSTWHTACQDSAYFQLGRIALRRGDWAAAELLLRPCLARNANHHQAIHLLIISLVEQGKRELAVELADKELDHDPFNFGVLFESAHSLCGEWSECDKRMRSNSHNYLELAIDYAAAGQFRRAIAVLWRYLERVAEQPDTPLVYYFLADFADKLGDAAAALRYSKLGAKQPRQGFFPNRREDLAALQSAVSRLPGDFRAWCDIGNLLFSKRRYNEAIRAWEEARDLAGDFAQPRRNLGLAYFNQRGDADAAWASLKEAFLLNLDDGRVLYELDQLAKRLNHDPESRLDRLQANPRCVERRDDLTIEQITLLNQLGRHEEALEMLLGRQFHPWEGGEGKASTQYVFSLTELARQAIAEERLAEAGDLLEQSLVWPDSLGEGKLAGIQENNIHYWLGQVYRLQGQEDAACTWFERASHGLAQPCSATYYNDQPPEMIFYQGLAHRALGRESEAVRRFETLIGYGQAHLNDDVSIDFFAVSLPDFLVFDVDLAVKNELHCRYMTALGYLGLRKDSLADREFGNILQLDSNHLGALMHRKFCGADVRSVT